VLCITVWELNSGKFQGFGASTPTFPGCLQLPQGLQGSTEGATISIEPFQWPDQVSVAKQGTISFLLTQSQQ